MTYRIRRPIPEKLLEQFRKFWPNDGAEGETAHWLMDQISLLSERCEDLTKEVEYQQAWREDLFARASKAVALDMPPLMFRSGPDGDLTGYVPLEVYTTARNQQAIASAAIEMVLLDRKATFDATRARMARDVESVIVDTIEREAEDPQAYDWTPISKAIDAVYEMAKPKTPKVFIRIEPKHSREIAEAVGEVFFESRLVEVEKVPAKFDRMDVDGESLMVIHVVDPDDEGDIVVRLGRTLWPRYP